jgi:hypothetical protein
MVCMEGVRFFPLGSLAASCELFAVVAPPDFTFDVLLYGLLVLGVFGFLWAYYDRRDRALYDAERRKITFHCIRCDHLFTEKDGTDTANCPKCGHANTRLKF